MPKMHMLAGGELPDRHTDSWHWTLADVDVDVPLTSGSVGSRLPSGIQIMFLGEGNLTFRGYVVSADGDLHLQVSGHPEPDDIVQIRWHRGTMEDGCQTWIVRSVCEVRDSRQVRDVQCEPMHCGIGRAHGSTFQQIVDAEHTRELERRARELDITIDELRDRIRRDAEMRRQLALDRARALGANRSIDMRTGEVFDDPPNPPILDRAQIDSIARRFPNLEFDDHDRISGWDDSDPMVGPVGSI